VIQELLNSQKELVENGRPLSSVVNGSYSHSSNLNNNGLSLNGNEQLMRQTQLSIQQQQLLIQQQQQQFQVQQQQSRPPCTLVDRTVARFAQFDIDPPSPGSTCPVCHLQLAQPSPCAAEDTGSGGEATAIACLPCGDRLHLACLKSLLENQHGGPNYVKCPPCGAFFGQRTGDAPPGGTMRYRIVPKGLPGYEDYHTIQVRKGFTSEKSVDIENHFVAAISYLRS